MSLSYRFLSLLVVVTCYCVSGVGATFIPLSLSDLTSKAVHLYGPPISPSNQLFAQYRLFPCMNFACSGRIKKLWFVSQYGSDYQSKSPPEFHLWRKYHGPKYCRHPSGTDCEYNQLLKLNNGSQNPHVVHTKTGFGVYEVSLSTNNTFEAGDVLGVRYLSYNDTLAVIYQSDGVYCGTLQEGSMLNLSIGSALVPYVHRPPVLPYIAIETESAAPGQHCAMGFLKKKSLHLIVDAPRNHSIRSLFSFTRVDTVQSVPINEQGLLLKLLIAARLNCMITSGWPVLQIRRRNSIDGNSYHLIKEVGAMMGPRPTGYLNVFEYDLHDMTLVVRRDDVIRVYWPQNNPYMRRYSLAYFRNSSDVMLAIEVQQNNNESMSRTDSEATAEPISTLTFTSTDQISTPGLNTTVASETSKHEQSDIAIVIGGVLCAMVVIILSAVFAFIVFVAHRHRNRAKNFSPSADGFSTSTLSRLSVPVVQNPTYSIVDGNVQDSVDQKITISTSNDFWPPNSAGVSQNLRPKKNNYKLYEFGVFVPTLDQREAAASDVMPNTDEIESIYSTLGENQYSTLHQFGQAPEFFSERDGEYWEPASDVKGLYEQLSNKKYREILRNQIQLFNQLGSGQFGNVMKGVWLLSGGSKDVAVKTLKEGSSEEDRVRFMQEAAINGQFWHPNIVKLMGVVTVGEPAMIILEFLSNGDLRSYLLKMRPIPGKIMSSKTPHTLLRFSKEIASGMKYLERKKFVHRDLAARNILLSEEKICKISDFGMSRDLENDGYYVSRGGMIPVKWTAPEALYYKKYSTLSDVWSFGCVLYEIWSLGHKPFEGYSNRNVISKVESGFRLPPPPGCPRDIYHLMIQCWHPNKNLRPSFSDLHTSLSDYTFSFGMLDSSADDEGLHPQAHTIGATLEAGKQLFNDLQHTYVH